MWCRYVTHGIYASAFAHERQPGDRKPCDCGFLLCPTLKCSIHASSLQPTACLFVYPSNRSTAYLSICLTVVLPPSLSLSISCLELYFCICLYIQTHSDIEHIYAQRHLNDAYYPASRESLLLSMAALIPKAWSAMTWSCGVGMPREQGFPALDVQSGKTHRHSAGTNLYCKPNHISMTPNQITTHNRARIAQPRQTEPSAKAHYP